MEHNKDKHTEIDAILNGILKETSIRERFEKRLYELGIKQATAEKLLKISYRTLNGILDGSQKRVDYLSLNKVAAFLNMSPEFFLEQHIALLEKNFSNENTSSNKKKFIRDHFDLLVLKKAGFIDSLTNFDVIEEKINKFFGFNSIFQYEKRSFDTAFWAGQVNPANAVKTSTTRDFWLTAAKNFAVKLDNPYQYDRQELIKYFPEIRWHSTNVELGLVHVIKSLFKLGVTVIFQSSLSSLHLRGATFSVDNKPCIVLTDYKGFYPTLWHCLIHELYHVLFDWEEIRTNQYLMSEDMNELLTVDENEIEADVFARRYLFSDVKEFARENNIHPSIIYVYNAFDNDKTDRMVWARARRHMPDIKKAVYHLENPWSDSKPIEEIAKKKKIEIYN